MAHSICTRQGNGATDTFSIDFDLGYLEQDNITAFVAGELTPRTLEFLSENLVRVGGEVVAIGTDIVFYRKVPKDEFYVNFADGDVINEKNLDTAFRQNMHATHEALDGIGDLSNIVVEIQALSSVVDEIALLGPYAEQIGAVGYIADDVSVVAGAIGTISEMAGSLVMDEKVFTADGVVTSFQLDAVPVSKDNVQVSVNGLVWPSADWVLVGDTIQISPALPNGYVIRTLQQYAVSASVVKDYRDEVMAVAGKIGVGVNHWVNPKFDIWQKGGAMAAPAAIGGYQCDFFGHRGVGSTVFVERKDFPLGHTLVPGNPNFYCRTTVASVAGANNYAVMASDIDGADTLQGEKSTLTFWAKADAPKNICIEWNQHFGLGGSPSPEWNGTPVTINLTTSWQRFDVVLNWPSVSGKVRGTSQTETDRIGIVFFLEAGSAFNARTNTLGQQSGVFDFACMSLRSDPGTDMPSVANPHFDYVYEDELMKCQRLMEVFTFNECIWSGYVETGTYRWLGVPFKVTKRRKPVITVEKIAAVGFTGPILAADSPSLTGMQLAAAGTSTINSGYYQCNVIVDANHPYTP